MKENKKHDVQSTRALLILAISFIGIFFIFIYLFGPWITYGENIPSADSGVWNAGVSYRITITRTGIRSNMSDYEILDRKELKELRKLVKEVKKSGIDSSEHPDGEGLFINGKRYIKDGNNSKAYNRIMEIIK